MADHRDGPRLANALFSVFQSATPRQQAMMGLLLNLPGGDTRGFASEQELAEEVEETRQHLLAKLASV